jgi:hypothetical protein
VHHFAGVWEEYAPFNSWADTQAVWNPDTPILIAYWKSQKTERGKGQWMDDIDVGGKLDRNGNKTQVIQNNHQTLGFDSPSLQAPKCLFQHPEVLAGGSPTKKSGQGNIHKLFQQPLKPSDEGPAAGQAKKGSYTPLQA